MHVVGSVLMELLMFLMGAAKMTRAVLITLHA